MENKEKIILHLCADIGSDTQDYEDNGYDRRLVGKNIGVENYHPPENVYGIIANPVCTMFSIARTNAKTPRNMEEGLFLVRHCLRIIWESQCFMKAKHVPHRLNFWVIENPATGYLRNYLGKPAFEYCPSEFGADYTKRTALWGNFNAPIKPWWSVNKPHGRSFSDIISPMTHRDKEERMHARSMCYKPFAKAFFDANR